MMMVTRMKMLKGLVRLTGETTGEKGELGTRTCSQSVLGSYLTLLRI
jgi:hypothetical protein